MRQLLCCLLVFLFWSALGGTVATSIGCGGGACIRNSDCADGFRCNRGQCVVETSPSTDAAAPSTTDAATPSTDAAAAGDAAPIDSGASDGALDSGSQTPDAN